MKLLLSAPLILSLASLALADGHKVITQSNGKLAIVEKGNVLVQQNMKKIVEIEPKTKNVV